MNTNNNDDIFQMVISDEDERKEMDSKLDLIDSLSAQLTDNNDESIEISTEDLKEILEIIQMQN